MYELILLSLLMRDAAHGYVIAGVINDVIGPFARASNGRIYPLLEKLAEEGLIAVRAERESEGGRLSRTFSITKAGRARFRELMLDTTSNPRDYRDIFAFKVTAFDLIAREERVRILEHYIEFARDHVRHAKEQASDLAVGSYGHSDEQRARFADVFDHLLAGWSREEQWAKELLEEENGGRKHRSRRA